MLDLLCSIILGENVTDKVKLFDVNDNRCRYHRIKSKNRNIDIVDKNICPMAYSSLYPVLFALNCNEHKKKLRSNIEDSLRQCPMGNNGVTFRIHRSNIKDDFLKQAVNAICKIINFFIPCEIHYKNITVEVVEKSQRCLWTAEKGARFYFNIDKTDQMCPAAFNSVYPFLNLIRNGEIIGCPDYRTHVRFKSIGGKDVFNSAALGCDSYSVRVKIIKKTGDFLCPLQLEQWYSIEQLLDTLGIKCLTSFHVAFPYLYALHQNRQLGYLSFSRVQAGICCPVSSNIKYMVEKTKDDTYQYRCIQTHPICPKKILLGKIVTIENFEKASEFYYSLNDLYVILKKLESYKKTGKPTDGLSRGKTQFLYSLAQGKLVWAVDIGD